MTLELIHDYDPSDDERSLIAKLAARLEEHARKNKSKWAYYEGKNALKDLNIALPAVASSIRAVVGWPEIVVDSLAAGVARVDLPKGGHQRTRPSVCRKRLGLRIC